jgi:hypothetical protein
LALNVGLALIALAIFIVPILMLHTHIGLQLGRINRHRGWLYASAINLLIFALVRPDGVHVFKENGLSALLDFIGLNGGYDSNYESEFSVASQLLMLYF